MTVPRRDDIPLGDASGDASVDVNDALRDHVNEAPSDDGEARSKRLDALASQLVWRIGRASDDAPVTVRVGLASSAGAFRDLPRLRTATDAELREAIDAGQVRVEWIGPKGR